MWTKRVVGFFLGLFLNLPGSLLVILVCKAVASQRFVDPLFQVCAGAGYPIRVGGIAVVSSSQT